MNLITGTKVSLGLAAVGLGVSAGAEISNGIALVRGEKVFSVLHNSVDPKITPLEGGLFLAGAASIFGTVCASLVAAERMRIVHEQDMKKT